MIKLLVELCRALGSKGRLQDIVDGTKIAQVGQLDSLLERQQVATPPRVGLRYLKQSDGQECADEPTDALSVLEEQLKEGTSIELEATASRLSENWLLSELLVGESGGSRYCLSAVGGTPKARATLHIGQPL